MRPGIELEDVVEPYKPDCVKDASDIEGEEEYEMWIQIASFVRGMLFFVNNFINNIDKYTILLYTNYS